MLITILARDEKKFETDAIINYLVEIKVNRETVWRGRVEHHRANGWQRLLEKVALAGRKKRLRPTSKKKVLLEDLRLRMDGKK